MAVGLTREVPSSPNATAGVATLLMIKVKIHTNQIRGPPSWSQSTNRFAYTRECLKKNYLVGASFNGAFRLPKMNGFCVMANVALL
jgi:hypothetical protein